MTQGLQVAISNPNGSGTIYYTTDGSDPRVPGGTIAGQVYTGPIPLNESATVRARVRSTAGDWSPEIEARFLIPLLAPTFLPAGSGDWTLNENWSGAPLPYPDGAGIAVIIPPPSGADRNVNLRAPVTIGRINFPQTASTNRTRVRDQDTGNSLTFQSTNGPAHIEVGGTAEGFPQSNLVATDQRTNHHDRGSGGLWNRACAGSHP